MQFILIIRGSYVLKSCCCEHWISEYWMIAPRGNTGFCSCKLLVTFSSTDQYIALFYACFCLKTPYLIYTVDSLPLKSQLRALRLMPEGSLSNTHIFSIRCITAFLHFGTWHRMRSSCLGAILNSKITNKVVKMQKLCHQIDPEKDTYLQYELKQESPASPCSPPSAENVQVWWLKFFTALSMSTNDHKSSWVLIWGAGVQINFSNWAN